MAVRDVPVGLSHFTADEQRWMQINLILLCQRNYKVELFESLRVVIAGARLKPCPHHVQPRHVVTEVVHFGEIGFDICRVPLCWPLHRGFGRDPVRSNRKETFPVADKVSTIDTNLRHGSANPVVLSRRSLPRQQMRKELARGKKNQ